MKRIFGDYAYGTGPRAGCWWDETCSLPQNDTLSADVSVDVAIIGGGYTGLKAAIRLAENGVHVAVLEAEELGWGASGRNGGFCCLGGGLAHDSELDARFGRSARLAYRQAERDAVQQVEEFVNDHALDVERHSIGETLLAHSRREAAHMPGEAAAIFENYGVEPKTIETRELSNYGITGPFHGALNIPIGFGLNPRKYLAGLVRAAQDSGVRLFSQSAVSGVSQKSGKWLLASLYGSVKADQVVFATNGYSSDDIPKWLSARFMPAQSTIIVTRPLEESELQSQGWTTDQMCYDTRNLLHYFRLMPDRRFLFGMRGGILTGAHAEARARARVRRHFERMFPEWSHVDSSHAWSGFVNLARRKVPFVGPIPGAGGTWAAMCFHGNGVAMGSYAGRMVADLVLGQSAEAFPIIMTQPLGKFPLGGRRRALMVPLYAYLKVKDVL